MYVLDEIKFKNAMQKQGVSSIIELSKSLGIHRNTIHQYLAGKGVFTKNFEKLINKLRLTPKDLINKTLKVQNEMFQKDIATFVDKMGERFPSVTYILFGSRAKLNSSKYSDWDIGVYKTSGIAHVDYLKMRIYARDLEEQLPSTIDLVNLNSADNLFLKNISKDWLFLTGRLSDWVALQQEVKSIDHTN
ncbi:MAG: helix-turn-helix domain-containing protein [Bacteriovoracaceae bacterium]|nr:helix-turn-helix domain-containing protein [Bacteriovoracaceae bacterium]